MVSSIAPLVWALFYWRSTAMLKKAEVTSPLPLKQETAHVAELDGDVLVRGLTLRDRLSLALQDGYGRMAHMLAVTVLVQGDDGALVPLFTADEWERFGAHNYTAALTLWEISRRLSDLDGEQAEKKSE